MLMSRTLIACGVLAALAGCQTRIRAEKKAETVTPVQKVVKVNGTDAIITTGAIVASGGWEASARSPLWATESLRGLTLGVATNGTVHLALDAYDRDLSTNAVTVVDSLSSLAADVTGKAVAAICAAYGGGAAGATSRLGSLTVGDIASRVSSTLAKKGITGATASGADAAALAAEVCADCADCAACRE